MQRLGEGARRRVALGVTLGMRVAGCAVELGGVEKGAQRRARLTVTAPPQRFLPCCTRVHCP